MKNYDDISDSELVYLLSENDENVKNIIYEKYNYIIDIIIKKYYKVIAMFNIDENDLRQEASYGFSDGINSYNEGKNTSLKTFLTICIERRVNKYLDKYTTEKAKIIKQTLSLDKEVDGKNTTLKDVINTGDKYNPLNDITSLETIEEIYSIAKDNLSDFEYKVFLNMAKGISYTDIAKKLDKTDKQIDNTIQRIKLKMRKILDKLN